MLKPALDFTAQETLRCLMAEETCWEATVQVEVGFTKVFWKAAVVTDLQGWLQGCRWQSETGLKQHAATMLAMGSVTTEIGA